MNEKRVSQSEYRELRDRYEGVHDNLGLAIFTLILMTIFILGLIISQGDNVDIDDDLAPYLCAKHNFTFNPGEDTYKIGYNTFGITNLTIYCRETTKPRSVSDGYLVVI